jgi:hypothetical protein
MALLPFTVANDHPDKIDVSCKGIAFEVEIDRDRTRRHGRRTQDVDTPVSESQSLEGVIAARLGASGPLPVSHRSERVRELGEGENSSPGVGLYPLFAEPSEQAYVVFRDRVGATPLVEFADSTVVV